MPICSVPLEELDSKAHRLPTRKALLLADEIQALQDADPVERLSAMIASAKNLRKQQDVLYSRERASRFRQASNAMEQTTGRGRLREGLRELKGELPKITFESPESMFSSEDIDSLFDQAHSHWTGRPHQVTLSIRTQQALEKIFLGAVPQPNELNLLGDVFGQKLVKALANKSTRPSALEEMAALVGASRTLLSTFYPDFSAIGRQGALAIGTPKEYLGNIPLYLRSSLRQGVQDSLRDATRAHPLYQFAEESGVAMPAFKRYAIGAGEHEEFLMASERTFVGRLLNNIPPVRMAQRGYETFLSKYRFDAWRNNLRGAGVDVESILNEGRLPTSAEAQKARQLGNAINALSGRGSLGPAETWAPALNGTLFSARNLAAKVQVPLSVFHPTNPRVRRLALQGLVGYSALYIGTLAMAKAGGADVELDPRSTDFGKIRVGPLRVDPSGGYAPIIRLVARVSQGKTKLSTGEIADMNRGEAVLRFVRSKTSPPVGAMWDVITGETAIGEDVTPGKQAYDRFVPITIQDIRDAAREGGWLHGVIAGALSTVGVGTTSYTTTAERREKAIAEEYEAGHFKGTYDGMPTYQDIAQNKLDYDYFKKKYPGLTTEPATAFKEETYSGLSESEKRVAAQTQLEQGKQQRQEGFDYIRRIVATPGQLDVEDTDVRKDLVAGIKQTKNNYAAVYRAYRATVPDSDLPVNSWEAGIMNEYYALLEALPPVPMAADWEKFDKGYDKLASRKAPDGRRTAEDVIIEQTSYGDDNLEKTLGAFNRALDDYWEKPEGKPREEYRKSHPWEDGILWALGVTSKVMTATHKQSAVDAFGQLYGVTIPKTKVSLGKEKTSGSSGSSIGGSFGNKPF